MIAPCLFGRLAAISRNVEDLSRSVSFYCQRLGFGLAGSAYALDARSAERLGLGGYRLNAQRLRYGGEQIELVEVGNKGRPYPADRTSADLLFQHFAVRRPDIEEACRTLFRGDIDAPLPGLITYAGSTGVAAAVTLPAGSGGVAAFKFRDPDGHPVELIRLPSDIDDPVRLTPGIDHSAISVSDMERSIQFYENIFGLSVGGRQCNHGPEQCALDGLEEAAVDVVALLASAGRGPHLELLGYRIPLGRKPEHDPAPADIASDRLVFEVRADSDRAIVGTDFCQDPDGHFVMIEII
jgi:catechol 2,3-dioxygenase-like lactoylglutathione lyase family enzyme